MSLRIQCLEQAAVCEQQTISVRSVKGCVKSTETYKDAQSMDLCALSLNSEGAMNTPRALATYSSRGSAPFTNVAVPGWHAESKTEAQKKVWSSGLPEEAELTLRTDEPLIRNGKEAPYRPEI